MYQIVLIWVGIVVCLVHSAVFSGLTIGLFGLSRLRLEVQAHARNKDAIKVLRLRKDANFLLATLLWGNVSVNVILTLLTNSVLAGAGAFLFSTIGITCFGEIMPQAYFSRHALKMGAYLVPIVRLYQWILFVVAKPTALVLDHWLGKEGMHFFTEKEFAILLKKHADSDKSDVDKAESQGAVNFLELDDIHLEDEGEILDEASIISLPESKGLPIFPKYQEESNDKFLQRIHESGKKWVVITNPKNEPKLVLDADEFLRDVLYDKERANPYHYSHRPIVVRQTGKPLGAVIRRFRVHAEHAEDDVIDDDLVLLWTDQKRIITGADILGRLLRGIVKRVES
ncbi:MAG: metal transporter CNNM [Candidatus Omnitrophota bacterium]|jgi:metal transporter CNNM